jgi:hypothetical protein
MLVQQSHNCFTQKNCRTPLFHGENGTFCLSGSPHPEIWCSRQQADVASIESQRILREFEAVKAESVGVNLWHGMKWVQIGYFMIYGICSMYGMYGIFTNLGVHVGKYSIQGAYVYIYIYIIWTHTQIYIYTHVPSVTWWDRKFHKSLGMACYRKRGCPKQALTILCVQAGDRIMTFIIYNYLQ